MTFRRKEGQGAAVLPDFDGLKPKPEPINTSAPPPSFVRFSGSILIIEDEPMLQKVAARVMGKMGNPIHVAGTGKEGLEILGREKDVALILLDYVLPDIKGNEVLLGIREISETVKVIICSGYPQGHYGEIDGADGWLSKPFSSEQAYNAVNSVFLPREGDY